MRDSRFLARAYFSQARRLQPNLGPNKPDKLGASTFALTRRLSVGVATKTESAAIAKKLHRATREFGAIIVLAGILSSTSFIDALAAKTMCLSDRNLTLDQYLELSADHANWHTSVFTRIPKGLKVAPTSKRYILAETTQQRVLPSEKAYVLANFRFGFEFTSPCRVQDQAGQWWLVYDAGFLTYVPASAAEVEK
jgi:hypothetical protein